MTLGERIRRLRTYVRVSQTSLAAASGLSQDRISRIERGFTTPTPKEIIAIATAFNLQEHIDIFGKDNMGLKAHAEQTRDSNAVIRQLRTDIERLEHVKVLLAKRTVSGRPLKAESIQRMSRRKMSADDLRDHRRALAAETRAKKQVGRGLGRVRTTAMKRRLQDQAQKAKK